MKNPEVTVYITNFNYADYIKKSIQSVLNQTFIDLELIVIDDGSTDKSKKIINEFRKQNNIRLIFQKNSGLNKSNNIAVKAARGRFVLRLDSDDYLDENAILLMYNKISKSDTIGLVYSDYYIVNKKNEIINHIKNLDYRESIKFFYQPAHGACSLIRKSFIEEVNFYDQRFKRQDGVDLWFKFINKFKIEKINLPLFYYRQHSRSLSVNKNKILQTRNKILRKYVKSDIKKYSKVLVIPARSTINKDTNIALAKLGNKNLISHTIDKALKSGIFNKIIITTSDKNIIKFLKENYLKKVKIHLRKDKFQFENTNYNEAIILAIKKFCKKIPDVLVISHYNNPFKKEFYFEKIVNALIAHRCDRILTLKETTKNSMYKIHKNNLVQINPDDRSLLKLEKKSVYVETGGITSFIYKKYLESIKNGQSLKSNYIFMDEKSSFEINTEIDLLIANKVIKNIPY